MPGLADGISDIRNATTTPRQQDEGGAAFEPMEEDSSGVRMLHLDQLNKVRTEHAAIVDKYNGMPLISLEALGKELCTNRWLCAVIHRVVEYGGGPGDVT